MTSHHAFTRCHCATRHAGTIGNLVAQFTKARGAGNLLITGWNDYRLQVARQCGIIDTLFTVT